MSRPPPSSSSSLHSIPPLTLFLFCTIFISRNRERARDEEKARDGERERAKRVCVICRAFFPIAVISFCIVIFACTIQNLSVYTHAALCVHSSNLSHRRFDLVSVRVSSSSSCLLLLLFFPLLLGEK